MPHFRKMTALALACCLFFSACNGGGEDSSGGSTADDQLHTFSLAYIKGDGTNPYLSDHIITYQNASLLYARLVTVSPSFEVQNELAASVLVEGTTVTVLIGEGYFADGSTIATTDVAASLEKARQSTTYSGRFANVASVTAAGNILTIALKEPDALFAYLLDFPILKASQIDAPTPIGSGRYTLGEDETGLPIFIKNNYYSGILPIVSITLVELTGQDALISSLNIGDISLYASENDYSVGGSASKTAYYKTNNLVFLGVNSTNPILQNPLVRQAIGASVNRAVLCDKAYYSRAYPAVSAINATYPFASPETFFSQDADITAAKELLASAGYTVSELDGIATDSADNRLSLNLLVCTQSAGKRYTANLVKEQLAKAGIVVTIVEVESFDAYTAALAAGNFDLYIGEVKLYNNLDLSSFFSGATSYGIQPSETLLATYVAFRQSGSDESLAAFETAFYAEAPFIPLLYRYGSVSYNRTLSGLQPTISDIFYQFDNFTSEKE